MAKLARESRLRERRVEKHARKLARKNAAAEGPGPDDQPADELTLDDQTAADDPTPDTE